MKRRNFIKKTSCTLALGSLGGTAMAAEIPLVWSSNVSNKAYFTLKYAPSLDTFSISAGKDPVDNLKFIADQGFRAFFDLNMILRSPEEQEKIANEARKLGLESGEFSLKTGNGPHFVLNSKESRDVLKAKMKDALEVQKRTGINTGLILLGNTASKLHIEYQTVHVIENLRMCCDIVGKSGLILVMEPLNTLVSSPGFFLNRTTQAKMICVAVNHPCCKMVNDLYHQQITEGNLIPNLEECWNHIGAIHVGDHPGRWEPTTGEINYKHIFKWFYDKKYNGVISCEHGKSKSGKEGEMALIQAYREVDPVV